MSAWCHVSSDSTRGNNQIKTSMWARIIHMYDQIIAENPNDIGPRNENQMKGRFKRLSENGSKWVAAYLTDGIYPSWAAFVKSITSPQIRKHKLFAQRQEAVRKDVERAFGVLQARFAFLRRPCLVWDCEKMGEIMIACIIMHNMIVEDERDTYKISDLSEFFNEMDTNGDDVVTYSTERIADLASFMRNREQLRNREAHSSLKNDLIEHI